MTLFHAITFGSTPLQSKGTKYSIPLVHDIVDYIVVGQCVFPYTYVHASVRVCVHLCVQQYTPIREQQCGLRVLQELQQVQKARDSRVPR